MRYVSLAIFLFGFWIALSGHYTPMLLAIGAASSLLCLALAARIRIVDQEGHPVALLKRALFYYPWLMKEIFKSGWNVARIILHPDLPVSPTMTTIRAGQKTTAGMAAYANSIMLTAGSIVAGVSGSEFIVHALERDGALELEGGEMDRRTSEFEGGA